MPCCCEHLDRVRGMEYIPVSSLSQRPKRQEDAHDHPLGRDFVQRQSLQIDYQYHHRQRDPDPPEHVRADDGPECVLRIRQHARHDAAGRPSHDAGDDGEQPDGGHGGQLHIAPMSHAAAIRIPFHLQRWGTYRRNGNERAITTDRTASKIHKPQAKFRVHSPQTGTQT